MIPPGAMAKRRQYRSAVAAMLLPVNHAHAQGARLSGNPQWVPCPSQGRGHAVWHRFPTGEAGCPISSGGGEHDDQTGTAHLDAPSYIARHHDMLYRAPGELHPPHFASAAAMAYLRPDGAIQQEVKPLTTSSVVSRASFLTRPTVRIAPPRCIEPQGRL